MSRDVPPAPTVAVPEPTGPRPRVLVIDDEARVGELLIKLLSPTYETHLELRAASALELIAQGARYDAILCDLMMPDMTGMDLQELLERDFPELSTRTVFMTGGAFTARAQRFVERYAERLLEKPFRIADVQRAVSKILASVS
jgi:CheY-like chemotaxis protein